MVHDVLPVKGIVQMGHGRDAHLNHQGKDHFRRRTPKLSDQARYLVWHMKGVHHEAMDVHICLRKLLSYGIDLVDQHVPILHLLRKSGLKRSHVKE
jgi:hypothetical protein